MSESERVIPVMEEPIMINSMEVNNWNNDNKELLVKWNRWLLKTNYIYDFVYEKYKNKIDRNLIFTALLSGISTLLTGISSALLGNTGSDATEVSTTIIWVVFGLSLAVSIISGLTTFLASIIKIKGWDTYTTSINSLKPVLNNLLILINTEMNLPDNLKMDANDFLSKTHADMLRIGQQCTNIAVSDYEEAEQKYNETSGLSRNTMVLV